MKHYYIFGHTTKTGTLGVCARKLCNCAILLPPPGTGMRYRTKPTDEWQSRRPPCGGGKVVRS